MKKKISLITLVCVGLSALIAIGALFGLLKLKGFTLDLLFSFLTLTVAGILTLNSCEMLEKKNKLAFISISLILLSTILVILCFFTNLDNIDSYMKLTFVISTLSICFNLISSSILKMEKNYKVVQLIAYSCYSIISIYLILIFLDSIKLDGTNLKTFILFIILSFVSMCTLAILSKKKPSQNFISAEYVKISKEEYQDLLNKKKHLEELLKEGKTND